MHFTYMVGGRWCPACGESLSTKANYCSNCGSVAEEEPPDARMSSGKRLTDFQECEDGGFYLVGEEEPEPFTYPVLRDQVLAAAKMKAKAKPSQKERVSLPAREVLAALPSMSKEEKRRLQLQLAQEEQLYASTRASAIGWSTEEPWIPEEGPRHHGYEAGRMEGVSAMGARSSGSQAPVVPSKDKPKVFKDKELAQMRKTYLYDRGVGESGRLEPSAASPTPTEEQAPLSRPEVSRQRRGSLCPLQDM